MSRRLPHLLAALSLALALVLPACPPAFATNSAPARPVLELDGYTDWSGAMTVLHRGDFVDPYLALQALLLADANGIDIAQAGLAWARWLLVRQKPDGTFARYCRSGQRWLACKDADNQAAVLAMWLRLLERLPPAALQQPAWRVSIAGSRRALAALREPEQGIYRASGGAHRADFLENLDVWAQMSASPAADKTAGAALGRAIAHAFWRPADMRFLARLPAREPANTAFYPDRLAQILPLQVDFPLPDNADPEQLYRR